MTTPPPDYDELARRLASSPLSTGPAEVQGLYVGLRLGRPVTDAAAVAALVAEVLPPVPDPVPDPVRDPVPDPVPGWAPDPVPDPEAGPAAEHAAAVAALRALAAHTAAALADPDLGFDLLLPPESRSLRERALAVVDWSRGLVYGFGLGGVAPAGLSAAGREALTDLLDITRMDPDDLDEGPANEAALTELVEFVRVAVMLLQDEQRSAQ